jgi:hypothetical protein
VTSSGSGRPRRSRELRTAGAAIVDALAFRNLTDDVRAQRALAEWSDLVGAKIAARTRPLDLRDRVLRVEVASSAWLHELNLLKPQLVAGLHERLGQPSLFDRLDLVLAGRRARGGDSAQPRYRRVAEPARPAPRPATGAAREQIVREVACIDDPELRELVARVRINADR